MYTITVAKSNRGNYHLSYEEHHLNRTQLKPLCRARAPQRRRRSWDDAPDLAEAQRKWDNTVHHELQCGDCTEEANRLLFEHADDKIGGGTLGY